MDKSKYTFSDLISILEGMWDENKVKDKDLIDWGRLYTEATESIIENLYLLENDSQRKGFLMSVFKRIFDNGKDLALNAVKYEGTGKAIEPGFNSEIRYKYVEECKLVLNGLIVDVSEACLYYDEIDFESIMKNSIRSAGVRVKPFDYVFYGRGNDKSINENHIDTNNENEIKKDSNMPLNQIKVEEREKGKDHEFKDPDFSTVLKKIRFDKNEETKKYIKAKLQDLCNNEVFKGANYKEMSAIALIFYKSKHITNTPTFSEWLKVFSEAFGKRMPTYKENQLISTCNIMKTKIPFIDNL